MFAAESLRVPLVVFKASLLTQKCPRAQGETAFVLIYALVTIRILKAMPWRVIGISPNMWVLASWFVLSSWVLKPLRPAR